MNTLRMVREYTRTTDYRLHLRFQHHRFILNRLGSKVKGHRAGIILEKAQNQQLNEKQTFLNTPKAKKTHTEISKQLS